jgi:hypothetical protein
MKEKYPYMPYTDLKLLVQQHKVTSAVDYARKRRLISEDAPASPQLTYKNGGWIGWHEFLGKQESYSTPPKEGYFSYEEARDFLLKCGFDGGRREYNKKCKSLSIRLPTAAQKKYTQDWTSWADYLGNNNIQNAKIVFIEFDQAKAVIASSGIKSHGEYSSIYKTLPGAFPSAPSLVYKNKGWKGWPDFLGRKVKISRRKEFVSFHKAKALCRQYKITKRQDYMERRLEISPLLPSKPSSVYEEHWAGWFHFLGGGKRSRSFLGAFYTYPEAKDFCKDNNIKTKAEYIAVVGIRKSKLPYNPRVFYKEFFGWPSFFDRPQIPTGRPFKTMLSYAESRDLCIKHCVQSQTDFRRKRKQINADIPSDPSQRYKGCGWIDWYHFLGKRR